MAHPFDADEDGGSPVAPDTSHAQPVSGAPPSTSTPKKNSPPRWMRTGCQVQIREGDKNIVTWVQPFEQRSALLRQLPPEFPKLAPDSETKTPRQSEAGRAQQKSRQEKTPAGMFRTGVLWFAARLSNPPA